MGEKNIYISLTKNIPVLSHASLAFIWFSTFLPTGQVTDLKGHFVTQVAMGKAHTCVLTKSGEVWTFGVNNKGQCGRDTGSMSQAGKGTKDAPDESTFALNARLNACANRSSVCSPQPSAWRAWRRPWMRTWRTSWRRKRRRAWCASQACTSGSWTSAWCAQCVATARATAPAVWAVDVRTEFREGKGDSSLGMN